jgi:hypothetical protein
VDAVEKIIHWLEYGVALCRWAIDSLRGFPPIPKEQIGKKTGGLSNTAEQLSSKTD